MFISFISYYRYRKFSRRLFSIALFFMIALSFFPVGEWLLYPLEVRYKTNPTLPDNVDGIIMLSGGEEVLLSRQWQQLEFDSAVERNLYFFQMMQHYPKAKFIYSGGGSAKYKGYSRIMMQQMIAAFNLNHANIRYEIKSKTTKQSVKNLVVFLKPKQDEKWVVITSAWHMPRAKLLFERHHWQIIPFPVDHLSHKNNMLRVNINFSENLRKFKIAIKEWLGIIAYQLVS